ncbi:MAG TPA: hypothetical protein VNM66_05955 [Thermodesulfobacteriota bacterium]|nr:hypothetical protein [Thermodesulfobacteriota bacterium]
MPRWATGVFLATLCLVVAEPGYAEDAMPSRLRRSLSVSLFVAAQATVAVDMAQTLRIRDTPGLRETNPLLGPRPADGEILALFGARLAFNTLAYVLLPRPWADALSVVTISIQVPVIIHNANLGLTVRF